MELWIKRKCLRCSAELITKEVPTVCPFCLADTMYLRAIDNFDGGDLGNCEGWAEFYPDRDSTKKE